MSRFLERPVSLGLSRNAVWVGCGGVTAGSTGSGHEIGFAVEALRRLVQAGARPRAAATVVASLTGTRANDLYTALTGRKPRR